MRADFIEAATLEIYRFVPPALLPKEGVGELPLEEFLQHLSRARYIQSVETYITASAIAKVFTK